MPHYKTYKGDPYWLNARFNSTCQCGTPIKTGDKIFYYPRGKTALCPKCGEKAHAEFAAAAADEQFMSGGY